MKKVLKDKLPNLFRIYKRIKNKNILQQQKKFEKYNLDQMKKELSQMYFNAIGRELKWDSLESYTEKMQWAKLYEIDSLKTKLTDKYTVREWVENKIGKEYLIPIYGVWENFNDINFEFLPSKFVLKTNHGSGTNIIVSDKSKININEIEEQISYWLKTNYAYKFGFQMQYRDIKPLIISEMFISDKNGNLNDYKFLCFNGKPYFVWVDIDRFEGHKRNIYDLDWNLQNWNQHTYSNSEIKIDRPDNLSKMIELVEILCADFSHVRVDLYNVDEKIYFGEMTFTNGSGFEKIYPEEADILLGKLWDLPIEE